MKLFFERLYSSIGKGIFNWGIVILLAIPIMLVAFILGCLFILLPIEILQKFIGDYAYLWGGVLGLGVIFICEWKKIKSWFIWQFVEPFKKN